MFIDDATKAEIMEKLSNGNAPEGMDGIAVNDRGEVEDDVCGDECFDICDGDFDIDDEDDDRDSDEDFDISDDLFDICDDDPDEFASGDEEDEKATEVVEPFSMLELELDDECRRGKFVLDVYSERIARTGSPRG